MATNALWLTLFTVIFDNQILQTPEVLALISGIIGAVIIAIGDSIVAALKSGSDSKEAKK